MTHVSTAIFQGLFKNIVFRSVAFVIKKLWAILDFFCTLQTFYRPVPNLTKKFFKLLFMKRQKNFTVIVSQMRVLGQKTTGGAPNAPPPSLYRVNWDSCYFEFWNYFTLTLHFLASRVPLGIELESKWSNYLFLKLFLIRLSSF